MQQKKLLDLSYIYREEKINIWQNMENIFKKCTKQNTYRSNIVGIILGRADFNCDLVTRPTISPKASTEDDRTWREYINNNTSSV